MSPRSPRLVTRFPTGHLYAVTSRRYLSVPELASEIGARPTVHVVDVETGSDVTRETLTRYIAMSQAPGTGLDAVLRLIGLQRAA